MRQSLIGSQGDFTVFVDRPISLTCLLIALGLILYPVVSRIIRKRRQARAGGPDAA
jgi:putative tricarboxylic transport membrane protein